MNKSQAILTVLLASTEDEPLAAHVVTARVLHRWPGAMSVLPGWGPHSCGRSLSQLYARGRISRVKTKAVKGYRYYLTAEQRTGCFAPVVYPHAAAFAAIIGPAPKIIERIRFLQRLQGLPAFTGEAIIDTMLHDYMQAHKVSTSVEEAEQHQIEEEMKRAKVLKRRAENGAAKARGRAKRGAAQHEIV